MLIGITGATGFVGRSVLAELSQHRVKIILFTRRDLSPRQLPPGCRVIQGDVHNPGGLDALDRADVPEVLIHLAWGGLPHYGSLHHFERELPAHYRFLKAMVAAGVATVIPVGTCLEYGMRAGSLHEDMPATPETPYGFAKDALRRQLEYLKTRVPFSLTWVRLFYLYGQRQPARSLFQQLKTAVANGDRVFNMSGGEQLRDYLAVDEAAKYLVALALNRPDAGVVNVCSGKPVAVRTLVEAWLRQNDWKIDLNLGYHAYPDYEPMAFWGSRKKLDALLAGQSICA